MSLIAFSELKEHLYNLQPQTPSPHKKGKKKKKEKKRLLRENGEDSRPSPTIAIWK